MRRSGHQHKSLALVLVFMLMAIVVPSWFSNHILAKQTKNVSERGRLQVELAHTKKSSLLRVNEIGLGMLKEHLDETSSMLDGRRLPHRMLHGRTFGYGHIQEGVNACSFVTFSPKNEVIRVEGYRLFLEGKQLLHNSDGSVKNLGEASIVKKNDGETLVHYPKWSLTVSFHEAGKYTYILE